MSPSPDAQQHRNAPGQGNSCQTFFIRIIASLGPVILVALLAGEVTCFFATSLQPALAAHLAFLLEGSLIFCSITLCCIGTLIQQGGTRS